MHGRDGEQQQRRLHFLVLLLPCSSEGCTRQNSNNKRAPCLLLHLLWAQAFAPFCHVSGKLINKTFPCICILCPLNLPLCAYWAKVSMRCAWSRSLRVLIIQPPAAEQSGLSSSAWLSATRRHRVLPAHCEEHPPKQFTPNARIWTPHKTNRATLRQTHHN